MAKYQPGDITTFYFIVKEMDGSKIIQGWTDNKDLAKFYMEFHKSKNLRIKSMTNTIEEINKISEENWNDEIKLFHINTRNRNKGKKNDDDYISICIPATETEIRLIREETTTFMGSKIDYGYINESFPYLKKKYQRVLQSIFLTDIIRKVVYSQNSTFAQSVEFDQLMVLFETFPENFGV